MSDGQQNYGRANVSSCPFPWDVAAKAEAMETADQAAKRHHVKACKLRAKARAMGVLIDKPGLVASVPLSSAAWDRAAAMCLAERKRAAGPWSGRS